MKCFMHRVLVLALGVCLVLTGTAQAKGTDAITRGEFLDALYGTHQRRIESEPVGSNAIEWAKLTGVLHGYEDGQFHLERPVTRAQSAVMLYRYAKTLVPMQPSPEASLEDYEDGRSVPSWCREQVAWAVNGRLWFSGSSIRLDWDNSISEAECALMLSALFQNGAPLEENWSDGNSCETASLTVDFEGDTVNVTLRNDGADTLFNGADYGLYHKLNGGWYRLNDDWAWIAMGYILEPGCQSSWEVPITDIAQFRYPPGEYRVAKIVKHMKDSQNRPIQGETSCLLYADFPLLG